jgi:hypothetical protein
MPVREHYSLIEAINFIFQEWLPPNANNAMVRQSQLQVRL